MNDARRTIPAVGALLDAASKRGVTTQWSRADIRDAIRAVVAAARASGEDPPEGDWVGAAVTWLEQRARHSLRPVVNATGVPLHTNLGRAPLADAARDAIMRTLGYSTLEFDVGSGERGSRQNHTRSLLATLTGAEDAIVANNAASAVMLVLSALAAGGETIVSRGELVEIGGSFRIPDILSRSGSVLIEVGTTNRTRVRDYVAAISPRTKLLLKVHRSNFHQQGFVSDVGFEELAALGAERRIPVVHDVGSGLLLSLESFGLRGEPRVQPSANAGAVVVFSGDKLVGGPQAGIVVGPRAAIDTIAAHPLARALRPDKTTLAGLEATLRLHRDPHVAVREIPVLRMLTVDPRELRRRARRLARRLGGVRTSSGESVVGGGAFPECPLSTTLVLLDVTSAERTLASLRNADPPVIARTVDGCVAFDVRTIHDREFDDVVRAVEQARRRAP